MPNLLTSEIYCKFDALNYTISIEIIVFEKPKATDKESSKLNNVTKFTASRFLI